MLKRDKRTSKTLLTTEGRLTYRRYRMYAVNTESYPDSVKRCAELTGSSSVYPLDTYLGVDRLPFKITVDMALRIAKIGATSTSYHDASQRFRDYYEFDICDDYIREVVDYIGEIILEEDKRLTEETLSTYDFAKSRCSKRGRRPKNGFVLYVEADGAFFNTRLTEREKQDNNSGWKENKLGIVFRSDSLVETGDLDDAGNHIYRTGDRDYICTTQGIDVFRKRLAHIMVENGLYDASDIVIISDGAPWVSKTREMLFPSATQILDLFHLKENVMSFGQYIHGNKKSEYYPWWKEVCKQLEDGLWADVLKRPEIAEYYEGKDTPGGVVNLYHYIWERRDIINYPKYREKGYFVGSGAVESGNKTVLQERLKLSGMKWYIDSAETLLALRAKIKSNRWNDYVIPLVRTQYSKWHVNKESVRAKQRRIHKKSGVSS